MLLKTIILICLLCFFSCANIKIKDFSVCADLSNDRGYCVTTLTLEESIVDGQEWADFNKRALKMSPESYGEIKAVLLKLCKKSKDCDFNEAQTKVQYIEQLLNENSFIQLQTQSH
ncbi:MAG TPA: hypothetical protein V6C58_24725 [Allocoleopsis sp.]